MTALISVLLPADTIDTNIDVVVDDDWSRTVARIPIMSPAMGFERTSLLLSARPASLPPSNWKAEPRKLRAQTNMYRKPMRRIGLRIHAKSTRKTRPFVSSSVQKKLA